MGILDLYNKKVQSQQLSANPNPVALPTVNQLGSFKHTSLDLENPQPLGGPINISYSTRVGSEIVTSPTTQPFTPKSTYTDSFTDPRLIARTIDPIK